MLFTNPLAAVLAQQKLEVVFTCLKEDPKECGSWQYGICIQGVEIGVLYKERVQGFRVPRGCIGGSSGSYGWEMDLHESTVEAPSQMDLWFRPAHGWDTLAEAKRDIVKGFDAPLKRAETDYRWAKWNAANLGNIYNWLIAMLNR